MSIFRQVRRKHKIRVDGPATIEVVGGRASIEIHHPPATKVDHQKPDKEAKSGLTKRRPKA